MRQYIAIAVCMCVYITLISTSPTTGVEFRYTPTPLPPCFNSRSTCIARHFQTFILYPSFVYKEKSAHKRFSLQEIFFIIISSQN
jgi:hypothetical protein